MKTAEPIEARPTLTLLRAEITRLEREQKSIPLTLENCERKQAIQDKLKELEAQFRVVSKTIVTH